MVGLSYRGVRAAAATDDKGRTATPPPGGTRSSDIVGSIPEGRQPPCSVRFMIDGARDQQNKNKTLRPIRQPKINLNSPVACTRASREGKGARKRSQKRREADGKGREADGKGRELTRTGARRSAWRRLPEGRTAAVALQSCM